MNNDIIILQHLMGDMEMNNVSIKTIVLQLIKKFDKDDVFALASQLAYSLILSFFPFLIFLMTVIGYLHLDSEQVLITLKAFVPGSAFELIAKTVLDVVSNKDGNLLSFSLIFTVWSASTGFSAAIKGLNKAYNEKETRGFIRVGIISVLCTLGISFIIITTLFLLVFGNVIGEVLIKKLYFNTLIVYLWNVLRYVLIIIVMIFTFAALYHYTPCKRMTWKEVIPGAMFTTVGWIMVSIGFSYYVNNFANYSRLYGSIGAVIVLMTWLFLTSLIMLMGGELNAVLSLNKCYKSKRC